MSHLTDKEVLRLHPPVSTLECALAARLNSCLCERDEAVAAHSVALESVQVIADLSEALETLKKAALAVIAHWEQGNLAGAVNDLRLAVHNV
jgi:hypothetical protein